MRKFLPITVLGILLLIQQESNGFSHPLPKLISLPKIDPSKQESSLLTLSATQQDLYDSSNVYSNTNQLFEKLDYLYTQSSLKIKCPFFRRRAADLIDAVAMITRFFIIRHKSLLGLLDPSVTSTLPFLEGGSGLDRIDDVMVPPGCRSIQQKLGGSSWKCHGLKEEEIAAIIFKDWTRQKHKLFTVNEGEENYHDKGYYITGVLNNTIYRDDCIFDGPDPDMPVRGLRKYLSAASKLFDHRKSYADLLDLRIVDIKKSNHKYANKKYGKLKSIEAKWRIGGVIMLPWKPLVKPYTGKTIYHLDDDGLIYFHEEQWDINVWEAFMNVLFPEIAEKIWSKNPSPKMPASSTGVDFQN